MSEIEISGTNKLAERILADARADAAKTSGDAERNIAAIRAERDRKLAERKADYDRKREIGVRSVLDGCRTRASLDGRKAALAKKRTVIDAVFSSAYERLLGLDESARTDIIRRLLMSEAEGGETVKPARADRALVERLLPALPVKLTLSADDAAIDGGFLLVNAGYEKDCSFRSLLGDLRDREETGVARLLFDTTGGQK